MWGEGMEKSINEYRDLLTVDEVAEVFRVHKSTVYKLIKSGQIRAIKLGREYKCPKSCIIESLFNAKIQA
jgi:excisionase family DNA binding protein